MTSQNSKTFSKSFFAENLHKFLLIYMEVLSKFPCEYRLKTKIDLHGLLLRNTMTDGLG
jgi:hypothetical protein